MAPSRGDVLAIEGRAGRYPEGDAEEEENRADPEHRRGLEDVAQIDAGIEHCGDVMALALAALAHANASHEHSGAPMPDQAGRFVDQRSGPRVSFTLLSSLHPWPDPSRC